MKIGINVQLSVGEKTGIGNYIYYLTKALNCIDPINDYCYFTYQKYLSQGSWLRILWEQFILPRDIKKEGADVIHLPDYALPIMDMGSRPYIITVHDLAFIFYPETFSKGKLLTKLLLIKPSLAKARRIIAVSENTKKDLIDVYKIPAEKIRVVYNGVDVDQFKPLDKQDVEKQLQDLGLIPGYILYIGTLEPRKNVPTIIKAYKALKEKYKIREKLVIGGGKGWLYDDIFRLVSELNLIEDIIFTGYVKAEDLPYLYNGAAVFVYPSLYEGFGFPPIEAMACGVPVVTGNVSSLPEVVGDAGIQISPTDVEAVASAIYKIISDPVHAAELSDRGLERCKRFTWEETAKKTMAVYREVFNEQQMR